jgi:hypothetical protein
MILVGVVTVGDDDEAGSDRTLQVLEYLLTSAPPRRRARPGTP